MTKKGFVVPLIIAVIAILAVVGGAFVYQNKAVAPVVNIPVQISTTTPIVGGDKDIHGCIGSAGYSWCAVKNKCLRVWEEKCEVVSTSTSSLSCTCPEGYVPSETICNPKCFYSTPRCLMPSVMCTKNPTTVTPCPQFMPPAPGFCADGKIVDGGKDANGCQMPPKCEAIACTMDAMMCPDGTYVGRSAPDCKFVCPNN